MLLMVLAMAETISGAAQSGTHAVPLVATAALLTPAPTPPTPPAAATAVVSPPASELSAANPATVVANAADPTTAPAVSASPPTVPPAAADPVKPSPESAAPSDGVAQPRDPWVKLNRGIFAFDIALERGLLAPVSYGYVHVVPHVLRFHVTSALFNLGEPLTAVNDLLQLRISSMGRTVFRFIVNSTVGIAGLFDVAKASGIPIHISDFGQTLGRYGLKPGPYVMIPVLGPSDLRDGFGRIVDNFIDPVELLIGGITSPEGLSLFLLDGVDWRSRSDDTLKAVYGATDPYAFTRSAYSQSRAATVLEATGKQAVLPDFDAVPGTP